MRARRRFNDRSGAGRALAATLHSWFGGDALVLGIPRGGIPVALAVAEELGSDVDVIVARKIPAPGATEVAMGAITADGTIVTIPEVVDASGVSAARLQEVAADALAEARALESRVRRIVPPIDPSGRVVLICDDGLATGATMRACVQAIKQRGATRVVVAVPVGSEEACAELRLEGAHVLCLERPDPFTAVGDAYRDFGEVREEEALAALLQGRQLHAAGAGHERWSHPWMEGYRSRRGP
jgi:putative phosphoribosyl transferase